MPGVCVYASTKQQVRIDSIHAVCRSIPPHSSAEAVVDAYTRLITAVSPPLYSTQDPTLLLTPDGSHNLLCTRDWMVLVPRGALAGGPVAQNALCFAGTLFLRTVQELAYVKEGGWGRVLQGVGRPWGDSL